MTTPTSAQRVRPVHSPRRQLFDATCLGPLRHTPGRALVSVLAIALGVALGFAVHLVNRVAADEVQHAARSLFGVADLSVQGSGLGLDEGLYPQLARLAGIATASPVVEIRARLPAHARSLQLLGVDPFRLTQLQAPVAGLGVTAVRATGLLAENSVWLSPAAANALDVAEGEAIDVQGGLETYRLRVAGLLPAGAYRQQLGMLDIAEAQWRFGRLGRLDRIDLRLAPGADVASVEAAIGAALPPGARLVTPDEAGDDALRLSRAYRTNLAALALVALFTGAFLVHSTQALAVARRRREIAFLHAMGLTVPEQLAATLAGGAIIGVAGATLGVVLGYLAARAGLANFGADLGAGYFRGLMPSLDVRPLEGLAFFALGLAAAVAATIAPALEAASVPPAAALRAGPDQKFGSEPNFRRRPAGAVDPRSPPWKFGSELSFRAPILRAAARIGSEPIFWLALAALVVLLPPVGSLALPGYLSIACLLIGAVLIAPTLARAVVDRLPTGGPAWRQVAVAQLRGTVRSTASSLAAVLVSFALMVAMAIMVQSFRESLDAWMQRILAAELYLRTGSGGSSGYFDQEAQRRLAAVPGVARVEFITSTEVALRSGGPRLTVVARPIDEASAARRLPLRRQATQPAPSGLIPVWASESALDLHGLDVGTEFDLPLGDGTVRAVVRGLWRDYERPGGAIVLSRETFVSRTGDGRTTGASLWLEPGSSPEAVSAALLETLPARDALEIARPGEIRRRSLAVFDRTFAVTYVLEGVAVLIGLFGISAATSAQVLARRAEFGMLRHVGTLRREIAGMLAFEGAVQGALGVLAGLVVGGLVSLVLIYVVNRQSFHWTMDLHVPWGALAALSAALIAAAAATAAVSGRLAMTADVVRAVREDW
jgi:putative ABC transport system permease protein